MEDSSEGDAVGAWFDRDVIRAAGPDAARFLQGQLSQDVEGLRSGVAAWSLLLDPSGKLVAWVRVLRVGEEEFLIDCDAGWAETVLARLERFKIRVSCDFEILAGRRMLSVRGVDIADANAGPDGFVLPAVGTTIGVVGYDVVGTDPIAPDGLTIDADAVEAQRIVRGVPAMGAELDDTVIPAEMGAWFVEESVSWTKGCYTGQELVARVDSRGSNTPRRLRSVALTAPARPGDELVDAGGKAVGEVTSVFGTDALARVARSVVPPESVTVAGHPAEVREI
ncbi:MAG TPA: hypothetical protein PLV93_12750 [Microthrixaceae bacterium]|nr:hypothetical protein [Microthrixaceae bacterium]HNI36264.1 hypothetical protein [Microthrixaceae bacterium]